MHRHRFTTRTVLAAAAAFAAATTVHAPTSLAAPTTARTSGAECDGRPGWRLEIPACAAVGSAVTVCMTGPANDIGAFYASLGQGPTVTNCGTLCLDFPPVVDLRFAFDAAGSYCFEAELPEDPELIGTIVYAQFVTCKPNRGVSNQVALEIIADLAPGAFVTFQQRALGVNCEGFGGPACRVEEWFDVLFPNGVILGDQDGVDGDGEFAIVFTSPSAIARFLPDDGPVAELDGDLVDPVETLAGEFAAELLAATLNFALDQIGAYDDLKLRVPKKLGDLVLKSGVNRDLFGYSIAEMIEICDLALSGALGEGDLDINGDGELDAYLTDLSDALKEINKNFDSGGVNLGNLKYR